jgi:hypothetical protein
MTNILDLLDFEKYFQIFKNKLINVPFDKINDTFNYNKLNLSLLFHQDIITNKTLELIEKKYKNILFSWKCRAGKTYGVGGLIIKYFKKYKKCNCLIITPCPKETITQFTDDLFHKFNNFDDFNIIYIKSSKQLKIIKLLQNNIIICSKQLLQNYILDDTVENIKNLKLDLLISDENHYGSTTELAKNIINSYSVENTIKIFLTATYYKTINEFDIPIEWPIRALSTQWSKNPAGSVRTSRHRSGTASRLCSPRTRRTGRNCRAPSPPTDSAPATCPSDASMSRSETCRARIDGT